MFSCIDATHKSTSGLHASDCPGTKCGESLPATQQQQETDTSRDNGKRQSNKGTGEREREPENHRKGDRERQGALGTTARDKEDERQQRRTENTRGNNACLHEVVIVGHFPALPPQLQPASHLQLALPVHDHDAPSDFVYTVGHIPHHLNTLSELVRTFLHHPLVLYVALRIHILCCAEAPAQKMSSACM